VEKKNSSGIKSIFFWMHTLIAGLTTYLVLHNWTMIMPAGIIFISHAVIDYWKIMRVKHSSK
jgi:membrane protein YdbS with pleckstrin-like domain